MKTFKFRLETLLKVKIREEEQRKIEFGEVNQYVEMKKKELQDLFEKVELFRNQDYSGEFINTDILMHRGEWLELLELEKNKKNEDLRAGRIELENRRIILAEAAKNRKALEILKEKKFEEFKHEEKKKEQAFSDEMGALRHYRNLEN